MPTISARTMAAWPLAMAPGSSMIRHATRATSRKMTNQIWINLEPQNQESHESQAAQAPCQPHRWAIAMGSWWTAWWSIPRRRIGRGTVAVRRWAVARWAIPRRWTISRRRSVAWIPIRGRWPIGAVARWRAVAAVGGGRWAVARWRRPVVVHGVVLLQPCTAHHYITAPHGQTTDPAGLQTSTTQP